jgi:hypothetical protein
MQGDDMRQRSNRTIFIFPEKWVVQSVTCDL